MMWNAGQVKMEAAGEAQRSGPEPDGVYETMEKAPSQGRWGVWFGEHEREVLYPDLRTHYRLQVVMDRAIDREL